MLRRHGATLSLAALAFAICLFNPARAAAETLTISSNNTPQDRKALQRLSQEAFRRVGVTLNLVSQPSERSLHSANLGEVDGEGLRVAGLDQQYPNLIQVPERYIGISFVAFAKDPTLRIDHGWADLKPYRVAFIRGWKMFENNASVARIVNKVEQPEQLFRMLDGGRIDLALYTLADGVAMVRDMGLAGVAPLSPSLKDVDMYLYLHRRHAALAPKLAQALRDMKADGAYQKILASVQTDR
jgi:polar amino acid transport system substrate-binding protein